MKRYIEVVEYGENGGEMGVVHKIDVSGKSERMAERVMDCVEINMDYRRFYTRFSPPFDGTDAASSKGSTSSAS